MLHRVVDRESRVHASARRVDVHVDVALRIFGIQEEQLGHDDIRDIVVNGAPHEHDPVHEEAAEDVVAALSPVRALDDVRRIDRHLVLLWADRPISTSIEDLGLTFQKREHFVFSELPLEWLERPRSLEPREHLGRLDPPPRRHLLDAGVYVLLIRTQPLGVGNLIDEGGYV